MHSIKFRLINSNQDLKKNVCKTNFSHHFFFFENDDFSIIVFCQNIVRESFSLCFWHFRSLMRHITWCLKNDRLIKRDIEIFFLVLFVWNLKYHLFFILFFRSLLSMAKMTEFDLTANRLNFCETIKRENYRVFSLFQKIAIWCYFFLRQLFRTNRSICYLIFWKIWLFWYFLLTIKFYFLFDKSMFFFYFDRHIFLIFSNSN